MAKAGAVEDATWLANPQINDGAGRPHVGGEVEDDGILTKAQTYGLDVGGWVVVR